MRRLVALLLGLGALATAVASGWALMQNPFAQPFRARNEAEIRVAVGHALEGIEAPRVAVRIEEALAAEETDEAAALVRFAKARDLPIPPDLIARVEDAEADANGWQACLSCAIDPEACPTLTSVAACNLPVEMTPVGDANAVRRAVTAYLDGTEIDTVDLTLALIGLGATGAIAISAGASATVKAGATVLRVARKAGAVSGGLMRDVAALSARTLRLDRAGDVARGQEPLGALVDGAAAAGVAAIASDVGRLTRALPNGDALAVLRYADDADELAALARVSDVAGVETRGAIRLLGKGRTIRLARRLSEMAILTMALIAALFGQLLALALWLTRRAVRP